MPTVTSINAISDRNLQLNREEMNSGCLELKSFPPVLFIELTQNCNLHCLMCRSAGSNKSEKNMSEDLFQRISKELFPFASIVDLRGWGESTLRKDLTEKILQTVASWARVRLVTNALALKSDVWSVLMNNDAIVVVSVDASTPETMRVLERGSFDALSKSLAMGAEARDSANGTGAISFNTVVSSMNLHELPNILSLAVKFAIKKVTLFPVVASRNSPLHLLHRKAEIQCFLDHAKNIALSNEIELRLGASLYEEYVVHEGLPDRCSHPWEYCYIDYEGNVGYCDHLIGNKALCIGNLAHFSFDEIWNGTEFQQLRAMHKEAKRNSPARLVESYSHCAWCYERRYVDFEDMTDPSAKSRVVSSCGKIPFSSQANEAAFPRDFMTGRSGNTVKLKTIKGDD